MRDGVNDIECGDGYFLHIGCGTGTSCTSDAGLCLPVYHCWAMPPGVPLLGYAASRTPAGLCRLPYSCWAMPPGYRQCWAMPLGYRQCWAILPLCTTRAIRLPVLPCPVHLPGYTPPGTRPRCTSCTARSSSLVAVTMPWALILKTAWVRGPGLFLTSQSCLLLTVVIAPPSHLIFRI